MGRGDRTELESDLPDLPDLPLVAANRAPIEGLELEGQFVQIIERAAAPDSLELSLYAEAGPQIPAALRALTFVLFPTPWGTRIVLENDARLDVDPPALTPDLAVCHTEYPSCDLPQTCLHQSLYAALLRDDPLGAAHLEHVRTHSYTLLPGDNLATQLLLTDPRSGLAPWRQSATRLCDDLYVISDFSPSTQSFDSSPCLAEPGRCYLNHVNCDSVVAVRSPHLSTLPTLMEALLLRSDSRGRELIATQKLTQPTLYATPGLSIQHPPLTRDGLRTLPTPDATFPLLRLHTPDLSTLADYECNGQQLVLDPGDPDSGGYTIPIACVSHRFCELCQAPMPCRHPELSTLVGDLRMDLAAASFGERLIASSFQHEVSEESR